MASIRHRPQKNGAERWLVQVRRKGEPSVAKTFSTRQQAEEFANSAEKQVASAPKPAAKRATLVKARRSSPPPAPERLDDLEIGTIVSAFTARPREMKRHGDHAPTVIFHVGDATVDNITNDWVLDYIDRLRSTTNKCGVVFAYSTIKKHMTLMKLAIEWRARNLRVFCPEFPFKIKDDFPRDWENQRKRRLTRDEQFRLTAQLRKRQGESRYHWRLLVKLAVATGARLQELLKAEWSEFHPEGLGWTIPKEHTKSFKERQVLFTGAARRTLRALKLLADPLDPRLFHTLEHIDTGSVSSGFWTIVKTANIQDFCFHDLRHEAVTQITLKNPHIPQALLMKMTGHASFEVFDRYVNATFEKMPRLN